MRRLELLWLFSRSALRLSASVLCVCDCCDLFDDVAALSEANPAAAPAAKRLEAGRVEVVGDDSESDDADDVDVCDCCCCEPTPELSCSMEGASIEDREGNAALSKRAT